VPVSLTYDEFVSFTKETKCHYCWAPITWYEFNAGRAGRSQAYNLDRKNSLLGYEKDNLVVCCTACNFAKGNLYDHRTWFAMTTIFRNTTNEFCRPQGGWKQQVNPTWDKPELAQGR
jgi:hypothetical protein